MDYIKHKYLEKGHTQSENDSVHAAIEATVKHLSIYTTAQWSATIRAARVKKPYIVKEMSFNDFIDFKALANHIKNFESNESNEKVPWNAFKILMIQSSKPNIFSYQTDYDGQSKDVNLFARLRQKQIPRPKDIQLERLRKEGIPKSRDKYLDLLQLCKSGVIPRAHHPFFMFLPHETL